MAQVLKNTCILYLLFLLPGAVNAQSSQTWELPDKEKVTITCGDSLVFQFSDAKGAVRRYATHGTGVDPKESYNLRQHFIVKEGKQFARRDFVSLGDSLLLFAVPDWNYRWFIYDFRLENGQYVPASMGADALPDFLTIVKTPYVFVNARYNYIASLVNENAEFFYGEESRDYCELKIVSAGTDPGTKFYSNVLRIDRKLLPFFSGWNGESPEAFQRMMKKVMKAANIPW